VRWGRKPRVARAPEDADAVRVEAFLAEVVGPPWLPEGTGEPRRRVDDALWLCPCYCDDDAPVWLVCSVGDDVIWSRVPDPVQEVDLVDARRMTGAHVHPATVLDWLHGRADDPGFDDLDPEDRALADRLRERLTGPAR
jgi:hypothetical protein